MRKLLLSLLACPLMLLAGCASAPVRAPEAPPAPATAVAPATPSPAAGTTPAAPATDIWPRIYDDETYLTDFSSSWTQDEAVGTIKNLQNSFVEHNADLPVTQLDADAYGLRARWSWTENGTFVKSAGFVIPFDQVTSVLLERYPLLQKPYTWGLNVYIANSSPVLIRAANRDAATRLGKAIVALSRARNAPLSLPDARLGAALSGLSAPQSQAAGIAQDGGVIVQWIFRESPAEKAGIQPQDMLLSAAGSAIRKTENLFASIAEAEKRGDASLIVSGLRRTYRKTANAYIEEFVPLEFALPVASRQESGAPAEKPTTPAFTVVPAWQTEKQVSATTQPAAAAEAAQPALNALFVGYVVPSLSGSLSSHLAPWMGPINLSFGIESSGAGKSSFLTGLEIELYMNFTDTGSMFLFNDMMMVGYSLDLEPLYVNGGLRLGLSMIDVVDDTAGPSYTLFGAVGGPEASVYLRVDPSLYLWLRGRYAMAAYFAMTADPGNPIDAGDNKLDFLSIEAGLGFRM